MRFRSRLSDPISRWDLALYRKEYSQRNIEILSGIRIHILRYPSIGITSRLEVDGLGERIKVNITILKNLGKVNQMYSFAT